jgi:hypothetical protein
MSRSTVDHGQCVFAALNEISGWAAEERVQKRYEKFRAIGKVQNAVAHSRMESKAK